MHALVALCLMAAPKITPAPKVPEPPAASAANPQEIELLLQSVIPAQRGAVQTAVRGLGAIPLYRVALTIDPATRTFTGDEQVRLVLTEKTGELVFRQFVNASYLNDSVAQVKVSEVSCPGAQCAMVAGREPSRFEVDFESTQAAGTVVQVNLKFSGTVRVLPASASDPSAGIQGAMGMVQNHGGGPSDHGAFGASDGVLALTGAFPQLAAHWNGVLDTDVPSGIGDVASFDVSNYLVTAEVPAGTQVIAAGARVGEEATPTGASRFTFAAAAVRDFPIYAGTWKTASEKVGATNITAYTLAGDEANGKIALGVASRALADFSKRFGAYPWTEFSVVEQPLTDGAGGIEYPTVVGVASLLYRMQQGMGGMAAMLGGQARLGSHAPNVSITDKMLEFAVAHEVAHQWWSVLVGSDPFGHPATDESLAQYSAALYVEGRHGKQAMLDALDTQIAMNFQMMRMSNEPDGIADQPTASFPSPLQYAGVVYGKAPLFFKAMRKTLGDKSFDAVLKRYAEKYKFGEAPPEGIVLAAGEVAPDHIREVEKLHKRWFDEAHGDEDLGKLDMARAMESMTGQAMSPDEKALLNALMPQLQQMLQGTGGGP